MQPTCQRTKSPTNQPTPSSAAQLRVAGPAPPLPLPEPVVVCPAQGGPTEILFQDFENNPDQAKSWVSGLESYGSGFTTFLGRLGRENPEVSKVFNIPVTASGAILEFDFYNIDGFAATDKAYVGIAGSYMDLGLFDNAADNTNFQGSGKYNDIAVTKSRSTKHHIGFSFDRDDQKFHVQLQIPARWFAGAGTNSDTTHDNDSNELEIRFKVDLARPTDETSAGIDNVRLTAVCPAPPSNTKNGNNNNRDLEQHTAQASSTKTARPEHTSTTTPPVQEPDMYADDGGYYCSADDFPCRASNTKNDGTATSTDKDEMLVHVCHYDTRRGYQTFCVPEADSDVLRFYAADYCGPCIGGFASSIVLH
jgi:hypothetical protein